MYKGQVYNKVSGAWKTAAQTFVKVSGAWKTCGDVYVKVSGVWKSTLYQSGSQNFTSPVSFTIPAGVYSLTVEMVGGGGGGGYGTESENGGGGGGGGSGGYIQGVLAVIPFTTVSYTPLTLPTTLMVAVLGACEWCNKQQGLR